MTINDHLALTAERRGEIDDLVLKIVFATPGVEFTESDHALLDLSTHVKALDARIENYARIFGRLEKAADTLAADDTNVHTKGLGLALQRLLIDVITPEEVGNV